MLKGLLSGAGMMRIGVGMMRRGQKMRAAHKAAPALAAGIKRAGIISKVQTKTRGVQGASNPRLFSKHTLTGQKRRMSAAALMRGRRAGLPAGMTHQSMRAAHVKKIISGVRTKTRMGLASNQLSKASPGGYNTRAMLARTIKAARQSGGSLTVNGKPITNLNPKRKHQGANP